MHFHYLQHVAFEGPGSIADWVQHQGHTISGTRLYLDESLPETENMDCLIVMGGPMGVADEEKFPWLVAEKTFLKQVIDSGTSVLGICLGAQLIAASVGASVSRNSQTEIGWFPITQTAEIRGTRLAEIFPENGSVFHWHADTFDIPAGARRIAQSEACHNQAFVLNDRVLAFQFHLETTLDSAKALVENCADELKPGPFVQTAEEMLSVADRFDAINLLMNRVMDYLEDLTLREQSA